MEKYCRARQATDDDMAHAHCMLDTSGNKHTLQICNTYYFSTATIVTRTHLNVTRCVHFLSCCVTKLYYSYLKNTSIFFGCIIIQTRYFYCTFIYNIRADVTTQLYTNFCIMYLSCVWFIFVH